VAYLGLLAARILVGDTPRRGANTKTGNTHARRVLVDAAWHDRHRPTIAGALRHLTERRPPDVISHAWKGQIICSRERTDHVLPTLRVQAPWRWWCGGITSASRWLLT